MSLKSKHNLRLIDPSASPIADGRPLVVEPLPGANSAREEDKIGFEEFSQLFYDKAPESFLKQVTLSQMEAIAREVYPVFDQFLSDNSSFELRLSPHEACEEKEAYLSLCIVIQERNFVADTMLEIASKYGLEMFGLTYSTLTLNSGLVVDVVYVELDYLQDKAVIDAFQNHLHRVFHDLVIVTDDFQHMLARTEEIAAALRRQASDLGAAFSSSVDNDFEEIAELLECFVDRNFIFLGYQLWEIPVEKSFAANGNSLPLRRVDEAELGFFRSENPEFKVLEDTRREAVHLINEDISFLYSRLNLVSQIHRHERVNVITFKTASEDGTLYRIHSFVGLVQRNFLVLRTEDSPFTRKKLQEILKAENFQPLSFDDREFRSVYRALARLRLMQGGVDVAKDDLEMILEAKRDFDTAARYYFDVLGRFVSVLVVMPIRRYSESLNHEIREYFAESFGIGFDAVDYYVLHFDPRLIRIQYMLHPDQGEVFRSSEFKLDEITQGLIKRTYRWIDYAFNKLREIHSRGDARRIANKYESLLPKMYRQFSSYGEGAEDVLVFESISDESPLKVVYRPAQNNPETKPAIKIYTLNSDLNSVQCVNALASLNIPIKSCNSASFSSGRERNIGVFRFGIETAQPLSSETVVELEEILRSA